MRRKPFATDMPCILINDLEGYRNNLARSLIDTYKMKSSTFLDVCRKHTHPVLAGRHN